MSGGYPVPARRHRTEIVVDRSRFVVTLARASTPDEARAFIDEVRQELPHATHHCWAFQAGAPGSTGAIGMSDHGEPHGTAGRPILEALLHSGVGEIVAVVSRWFGGVKLGKGGLARAYGGSVREALESLRTIELVPRRDLIVEVGYEHVDALRRVVDETGAELRDETYGADVRYRVGVPREVIDRFTSFVAEATAGAARVYPATERTE